MPLKLLTRLISLFEIKVVPLHRKYENHSIDNETYRNDTAHILRGGEQDY